MEYPDGNRWQLVILHFEAKRHDGELYQSDETTVLQFNAQFEISELDMSLLDRFRVADAYANQASTIIRNDFGL